MNHPETILNLKHYRKINDYLKSLKYAENDIRLEYFQYMSSILDRFHKGFATMDLIKYIYDNKIIWDKILESESFSSIFVDYLDRPHWNAYFNDLSRRLIIDSWSIFELTITQLLDYLLPQNEKDSFINKEYNEIKSILDENNIDELKRKRIEKLLSKGQMFKNHITHVSIPRRYDKVFKYIRSDYSRDLGDDKKFLKCFGTYRNTMHMNQFFSGKDFQFAFDGLLFSFKNNEPVSTPREPWEARVVIELTEIVKEIFNCINSDFIESKIYYHT